MEKTIENNVYVICRGYYCGVHAGYIKEREGNHVVLNEALRNDRAMLRNFRGEANAMLNGILLAIAKLKCRNASIN